MTLIWKLLQLFTEADKSKRKKQTNNTAWSKRNALDLLANLLYEQ